jgi:peptide/nickel transport system permease protein
MLAGVTRRAERVRPRLGRGGLLGLAWLLLVTLVAVCAPLIAPGDPLDFVARPLIPPFVDPTYPLGTDQFGRDEWAMLVHGARVSLVVGLAAAAGAIVLGTVVGTLAGFLGGRIDDALMRVTEAVQTVPTFILALALVSALGPSVPNVVVAIAISSWPATARLVRAEILSLRHREYVDAARLAGAGELEIAFREVLPGALNPVAALVGVTVGAAILVESALAFLGLSDPNVVSWGAMIADGREAIRVAPTLVIIPGIAVALTVLAVSLLGDALGARLAPHREG